VDPGVSEPFPVTWGQLELPTLAKPWTIGDAESLGRDLIRVRRAGASVGFVRMYVSRAGTYPSVDLVRGGFMAVWQLAAIDIGSIVGDRATAGSGIRAEPEAIREVRVAGGRGVRTAFRDVDVSSGDVIGRFVFIYHWDGRALWMFMTNWPPDDVTLAFDTLADQIAFDPQFEALVAGMRLPAVLPSPKLE
jgi:hypothetical protein